MNFMTRTKIFIFLFKIYNPTLLMNDRNYNPYNNILIKTYNVFFHRISYVKKTSTGIGTHIILYMSSR